MRYFTYISDAKVEMLLPQIPAGTKETIAAELGFNVGVLSGKIGAKKDTLDSRVTRLLAVEKFICANETLGRPKEPASWIAAPCLSARSVCVEEGAVLWVTEDDGVVLALAGSSAHLAGTAAPPQVRTPFSSLAGIMTLVRSKSASEVLVHFDGLHSWPESSGMCETIDWLRQLGEYVMMCVEHQPPQRIKFLARSLLDERDGGDRLILASPLYVETVG